MAKRKLKKLKKPKNRQPLPPKSKSPQALPRKSKPAAPASERESRGGKRIHPSMDAVVRWPLFNKRCQEVRATLPAGTDTFSVSDVKDPRHRQWLKGYLKLRETGELDPWRTELLDRIKFDWTLGEELERKQAKWKRVPIEQWEAAFERLQAQLKGKANPVAALVMADDESFDWGMQHFAKLRSGYMGQARREKIAQLFPESPPWTEIQDLAKVRLFRRRLKLHRELTALEGDSPGSVDATKLRMADQWADEVRLAYEEGKLEAWKVQVLEQSGFRWARGKINPSRIGGALRPPQKRNLLDRWRDKMEKLLALEAEYGKPVPTKIIRKDGMNSWVSLMRKEYRDGKLPEDFVRELEEKGFEFDGREALQKRRERDWQKNYRKLKKFHQTYGHAQVPSSYEKDPELAGWLKHQRDWMKKERMSADKRAKLEELGVKGQYTPPGGRKRSVVPVTPWQRRFDILRRLAADREDGRVPPWLELDPKIRLWIRRQQNFFADGQLLDWQVEALRSIGIDPAHQPETPPHVEDRKERWKANLEKMRAFVAKYGHSSVPKKGPHAQLYNFIMRVRMLRGQGKLSEEEIKELREAGVVFDPSNMPTPSWMNLYGELRAYYEREGTSAVPRSYPPHQNLAEFVAQQKQRGRKGMLFAEHIRLLDKINFPWTGGRPTPREEISNEK